MEQKNYHSSIAAHVSPKEAFASIANVSAWWAKNFKGKATKNGDTFRVTFGDTWVDFEIADAIPEKQIVWKVKDCHLPWLKDKKEWNNTQVNWKISSQNGATKVDMTHIGLIPSVECYEACEEGWNGHVKDSLQQLLNTGKGKPE
jgi:hypothetical protein